MTNSNRAIWSVKKIFNETTGFVRTKPNFIIIGSSYCGKTLLYDYMTQHPHIKKNLREETGYYISNSQKGQNWYKSNFPSKFSTKIFKLNHNFEPLIGETVNLAGTFVPQKVASNLKNPKIISILRNPVDRTYARYLAMVRAGLEKLSFEDAIENERDIILKNEEKFLKDGVWPPLNSKLPLYRLSGIYIDYILRWDQFFSMKKMLTVSSEELFEMTLETINKAIMFLDLSPLNEIKDISINFEKSSEKMKSKTRDELTEYFRPHNARLFDFIGKKFDWD